MSAAASATLLVQVRFPEQTRSIQMLVNENVSDLALHLKTTYPHMFLPSTLGLSAPYPQVLKVFLLEVVGTTVREIPPATLLSSLPQTAITAQAAFASVPYALFRTVEPNQVEPAEDAHHPNALTAKSPLFCAAFSAKELPTGTHNVQFSTINGKLSVCGVSTFVLSSEVSPHGAILFTQGLRDPIQLTDVSGCSYMTITSANLQAPQVTNDMFGCLHAREFYEATPWGSTWQTGRLTKAEFPLPHSIVKKKRDGYFCFKLAPNTDLTSYGLAVVFDNNGAGHHSLIPLNVTNQVQVWVQDIRSVPYQVFYTPNVGTAAREFQLCCFKIIASAGIFDFSAYPPDDPRSDVVRVGSLLFDQTSSLGISHEELDLALEELQACKFEVKRLSHESAGILKAAVNQLEESQESSSEIRELCANVLRVYEQT